MFSRLYYRLRYYPWRRNVRFFFQWLFRGFSDEETWNLETRLAEHILPRLKRFKQVNMCHPEELTIEQYDAILDQMIEGFAWFASDFVERDNSAEAFQKAQTGIELFAKYYAGLWW